MAILSFFFIALDNPLIKSRILSEIDALTNASHVVIVYAHVQNHVTSRKENCAQPHIFSKTKKKSYRGRAVLRIPWVSKPTINKRINAWGLVCYPIYQHTLEVLLLKIAHSGLRPLCAIFSNSTSSLCR